MRLPRDLRQRLGRILALSLAKPTRYSQTTFDDDWRDKRSCGRSGGGDYWGNLGSYGSPEHPIYSSVRDEVGYYKTGGLWVRTGDAPSQHDEEREESILDAEIVAGMSDEEIAELSETPDLAHLHGDMEFMPETEQERHVQRWLAVKGAQCKRLLYGNPVLQDDYHPHLFSGRVKIPSC